MCLDPEVPVRGSEGCSVHVRALADALVDDGHDVVVLAAELGEGD